MLRKPAHLDLLFVLTIALVVWATFHLVAHNSFVAWDDDAVVEHNFEYRGLSAAHLKYMFTNLSRQGYYCPLTWMTFSFDYFASGVSPRGVHLTSLVIHLLNTVLFFASSAESVGEYRLG